MRDIFYGVDDDEIQTEESRVWKLRWWIMCEEVSNLRAVERKRVMKVVAVVDGMMHNLVRNGIDVTEVNRLTPKRFPLVLDQFSFCSQESITC